MNRLFEHTIERVFRVKRKTFTDTQENGTACILCGAEFLWSTDRIPWACLRLPWRHQHFACRYGCTLQTVEDVTDLFRSAIPAKQNVLFYRLGVDDIEPQGHADTAAAGPRLQVEIVHHRGILTTRPIPADYADRIAQQAMRLGYTAWITLGSAVR
jgi:hypothetical protein